MKLGKKRKLIIIFLASVVFIALTSLVSFFLATKFNQQKPKLESYIRNIVERCKNSRPSYYCYDKEIPRLMDPPFNLSMEDIFSTVNYIQQVDNTYSTCHNAAHWAAEKEVSKDPNNWKDVIARCPDGSCSNGCLHGVFQARFKKEYLSDSELRNMRSELQTLCTNNNKWASSGLKQGSCYHGLGHLFMYITQGDINKSLNLCDDNLDGPQGHKYLRTCFDGVFMKQFQPEDGEGLALIKGRAITDYEVPTLCNQFSSNKKLSCFLQSWPLFMEQLQSFKGIKDFCSKLPSNEEQECLEFVFYILPFLKKFDDSAVIDICVTFSNSVRQSCFNSAAAYLLDIDPSHTEKAVNFCSKTISYDTYESCYEGLAKNSSFFFQKNSEQYKMLCDDLPDNWKDLCLSS